MTLEVTTFVNGKWRQNCYLAASEAGDAIIIDPGSQAGEIIELIEGKRWHVHAVINTHGHFDHVGAVADLVDRYRVPFYLHRADESLLRRANLYRMLFEAPDPVRIPKVTNDLASLPATFQAGPLPLSWIHTPGHTEGSVCLGLDGYLFSGDTLMRGTVGRTDLPGADRSRLMESLRRLMRLPGETIVCGGHGPRTTLAEEFGEGAAVWSLLQ